MADEKRGRGLFDGWSKSNLKSVLEGCSWQWALQRLGGLESGSTPHSCAGTGLHAAIEWHEQCRIDGLPTPDLFDLVHEARRAAEEDARNIPMSLMALHGGVEQAKQWAAELTVVWFYSDVRQKLLTYTPIEVEPHIEVGIHKDGAKLRGYLDWLGRDADGVVTIIDYKSAANTKRWTDWKSHIVEASVYLYLASALFENERIRMEWHVIPRSGEPLILEGPSMNPDIAHFVIQRVTEAQAILDAKAFRQNTSWNLCSERWCNFYHGCQVTGQLGPDHIDFTTLPDAPLPAPATDPEG